MPRFGSGVRRAVAVTGVSMLAAATLWAASAQAWRHRSRGEREQGDLQGVSLLQDGTLTLGPAFETLGKAPDPYFWSLARDGKGTIYAGGGNEGKVYRLGRDGKLSLFYDSPEVEVHALAVDPAGNVYVGTSPRGKIYRVDPSGRATEFFNPGETYIWALAFDRKGNLIAGTGTNGKIFRIGPGGKGEVVADTDEAHVRAVAPAADGSLYAGTDGKGLILKVDAAGKLAVLATAPLGEVTALALTPAGKIYYAAAGQSAARAAPRPAAPAPSAPRPPASPLAAEEPPPSPPPSEPGSPPPPASPSAGAPPASGAGVEGKVMVVESDGYSRELWSGTGDLVLSLALDREGAILAGTGVDGKVLRIDPASGISTLLTKAESSQITALLPEPEGSVLAAGSNLGAVYRLGARVAGEGTYESAAFDARVFSSWGRLSWRAQTPPGTSVRLQVRSGNTAEPDASWSEWSKPVEDPQGAEIDRPRARYIQWKAVLRSGEGKAAPRLGEVTVNYLQRNLPPELRNVEVQGPGVVFQKPNKLGGATASTPDSAPSSGRGEGGKPAHRAPQQPRPQNDREGRAVQWTATDPNGDDLVYSVYYRGVDEKEWKLMEKDLTDSFYSWDASAMADGSYLLRVEAEDTPSNPAGTALAAERLSDPFDVDNNPPALTTIRSQVGAGGIRLEFEVSDAFSNVGEVLYSVDAGPWETAAPLDGIADSRREAFRVEIPAGTKGGETTVVVKASDAAGNTVTGRALIGAASER